MWRHKIHCSCDVVFYSFEKNSIQYFMKKRCLPNQGRSPMGWGGCPGTWVQIKILVITIKTSPYRHPLSPCWCTAHITSSSVKANLLSPRSSQMCGPIMVVSLWRPRPRRAQCTQYEDWDSGCTPLQSLLRPDACSLSCSSPPWLTLHRE